MSKKTTKKKKTKNPYVSIFIKFFLITAGAAMVLVAGIFGCAFSGLFGSLNDIDLDALTMDYSTQILYTDANGNEKLLTTISSEQNRVWVEFEDIPQDLKDAIVAEHIKSLNAALKDAFKNKDNEKIMSLLKELNNFNAIKVQLAKELGERVLNC